MSADRPKDQGHRIPQSMNRTFHRWARAAGWWPYVPKKLRKPRKT